MRVPLFLADNRVAFERLYHAPAYTAQRRAKYLKRRKKALKKGKAGGRAAGEPAGEAAVAPCVAPVEPVGDGLGAPWTGGARPTRVPHGPAV